MQRTAGSSMSLSRIAESDVLGDYLRPESGLFPQVHSVFRSRLKESKGKKPTRAYLDGVAVKLGKKAALSQQRQSLLLVFLRDTDLSLSLVNLSS